MCQALGKQDRQALGPCAPGGTDSTREASEEAGCHAVGSNGEEPTPLMASAPPDARPVGIKPTLEEPPGRKQASAQGWDTRKKVTQVRRHGITGKARDRRGPKVSRGP